MTQRNPYAQIYTDKAGLLRWRMRGANGEPIADSGQGYVHEDDLLNGLSLTSWRRLVIDGDYSEVFTAGPVPPDAPTLRVSDLREAK